MYSLIKDSAEKLQLLPSQCRWAVADSSILQSITFGIPVKRGLSGNRLKILVKLFTKLRLVYPLLFMVGALELAKLLIRQRRKSDSQVVGLKSNPEKHPPLFYFVGFGAGPEESLFDYYCAEKKGNVLRIDQTKVESMGQIYCLGIFAALGSLFHSFCQVRHAMLSLPAEFEPWKEDFFTFIGSRIGYFSYSRAWFARLKLNAPDLAEVCFLSGDTAAFAAVNVQIPTRYLQHGLIRRSLVLPDFDHVDALTGYEVIHFRQRLPYANVHLVRPYSTKIVPRQPPCMLVASAKFNYEEKCLIRPILEFASHNGMVIYVRPHPREDTNFWHTIDMPVKILMEESDLTFDAAIDRLQPTIVVSSFSTTLVNALNRGVIPVSVSACDDFNINDMVFPLSRHCLNWPEDFNELQTIIFDKTKYQSTLSRLRLELP